MNTEMGGPRPNSRPPRPAFRQLTIGECIAIARYAPHGPHDEKGRPDVKRLLALVDEMAVCMNCGWPVDRHDVDELTARLLRVCAQYRR